MYCTGTSVQQTKIDEEVVCSSAEKVGDDWWLKHAELCTQSTVGANMYSIWHNLTSTHGIRCRVHIQSNHYD